MKTLRIILILLLALTNCTAQNALNVIRDIENHNIIQLTNGLRFQIVTTTEFEYITYRLTADVSGVGEGQLRGIKQTVADITGCDLYADELMVKKMVSHKQAIDSLFQFMALVIYKNSSVDFADYKSKKIQNLKNQEQTIDYKINIDALKLVGAPLPPTSTEIEKISLQDVEDFKKQCFSPDKTIITVVSQATPDEIMVIAQKYFGDAIQAPPRYQTQSQKIKNYDAVYFLDGGQTNECKTVYKNYFPCEKTIKNILLSRLCNTMLYGNGGLLVGETDAFVDNIFGLYTDINSLSLDMPPENFEMFSQDFYETITTASELPSNIERAKSATVAEFFKYVVRPENAAQYASEMLVYKLPKNFYTTYEKNIGALTQPEVATFLNQTMTKGGQAMVVYGSGQKLLCSLYPLSTERDVCTIDQGINTTIKFPKDFGIRMIFDNYLKATGLNNPPKNLEETYTAKYIYPDAEYEAQGKVLRKYPQVYLFENRIVHMDSAYLHYLEIYDGVAGFDSTMLYNGVHADSIRLIELKQKASYPIESFYNKLKMRTKFICDYGLDTAGLYLIEVVDPLGRKYHDYFSSKNYLKLKSHLYNKAYSQNNIYKTIVYQDYKNFGDYFLPEKYIETSPELKIEITIKSYNPSVVLKKSDFEFYKSDTGKKKKKNKK